MEKEKQAIHRNKEHTLHGNWISSKGKVLELEEVLVCNEIKLGDLKKGKYDCTKKSSNLP